MDEIMTQSQPRAMGPILKTVLGELEKVQASFGFASSPLIPHVGQTKRKEASCHLHKDSSSPKARHYNHPMERWLQLS